MSERFLVVRLVGLGDIATASTLVTRIRAERASAHITWLCGAAGAPLVSLFGVDEIVTLDEHALLRGSMLARASVLVGVWRRLAGKRFDTTLLVHADRRYRVLVAPIRTGTLRTLNRLRHGTMNPIPGRFFGDEYARLLDGPTAVGPEERKYPLADVRGRLGSADLPPSLRAKCLDRAVVILVPGGARNVLRDDPLRRWPVERYAEVARQLIADENCVILIGDAGDTWVRDSFAGVRVHDLIGSLNIEQTLGLMATARLVISHDTGPIHLARLVRAPLLALFGPTTPAQVLGPSDEVEVIWGGADLACRPCFDGRDFAQCASNQCIREITSTAVLARAREMLRRGVPSS